MIISVIVIPSGTGQSWVPGFSSPSLMTHFRSKGNYSFWITEKVYRRAFCTDVAHHFPISLVFYHTIFPQLLTSFPILLCSARQPGGGDGAVLYPGVPGDGHRLQASPAQGHLAPGPEDAQVSDGWSNLL